MVTALTVITGDANVRAILVNIFGASRAATTWRAACSRRSTA